MTTDNPIMDEEIAEAAYVSFKKTVESMDEETADLFWKKVYWYLSWRIPYSARNAVEMYNPFWAEHYKCPPCKAKYFNAHQHRPGWIRKPPGGDDYDNGKVAERIHVPL